jgi:lipoprotein-anchoring transpeptidase ErfK/SrfK
VEFEGASYFVTVDGKVVPTQGTFALKKFSEWQGVSLGPTEHFPFGWVTPNKAPVYDAPNGKKIETLERRTRVDILAEEGEGRQRWVQIGEGRYMKAAQLNEVRKLARPAETGQHPQWIDVDLGEQVVVAYSGETPVFATLTSSGREPNHTPRGNYPVWGKATAITMKSQAYDDAPYYVNRVPWVMFFQAHNALHAAYWHDRFGAVKSHGCANLSPRDARTLFDSLEPPLPPGWTSVRYWNLEQAPVVHVRNSERTKKPIFQERNIGPPDKNDEAERLAAAVARREAAEREEALRAVDAQGALMPGPMGNGGTMMIPGPVSPVLPPAPLR